MGHIGWAGGGNSRDRFLLAQKKPLKSLEFSMGYHKENEAHSLVTFGRNPIFT